MRKTFVLDTNVLLHNADALTAFADNKVVVCMDVLEELDRFKRENDEKGRNARTAIRMLDGFRENGNLSEGVDLPGKGILQILHIQRKGPPDLLDPSSSVNRILLTAYELQAAGDHVIFVSKDINARVKSEAINVAAMDFEKQKIDFDHFYFGWKSKNVDPAEIETLRKNGEIKIADIDQYSAREFLLLKSTEDEKNVRIAKNVPGRKTLKALEYQEVPLFGITAKNEQQKMAIELLLDDSISLVTLVGRAGTGKTLLALAAGLVKVMDEHKYNRMLVSRPIIPLGKDIGYLPGSKDEKLGHWMHPIFDNLDYILHSNMDNGSNNFREVEDLFDEKLIELEPLTYIRGRSIPRQYIVIDEAQNLTPHEVKTIVTRAGNNTKMILTGDPYQIDNPYLDASSNGLTYLVERMKDQKIFGHVNLIKSERSLMASLAAKLL